MSMNTDYLLTINGGSSSIKFALYQADTAMQPILSGKISRIGQPGTNLSFEETGGAMQNSPAIQHATHSKAANYLLDWLEQKISFAHIRAVGHRVVHGMQHTQPERVTPALLAELHHLSSYDTEHLPLAACRSFLHSNQSR